MNEQVLRRRTRQQLQWIESNVKEIRKAMRERNYAQAQHVANETSGVAGNIESDLAVFNGDEGWFGE